MTDAYKPEAMNDAIKRDALALPLAVEDFRTDRVFVHKMGAIDAKGRPVFVLCGGRTDDEALALNIVRAVNTHVALLEVLRVLKKALADSMCDGDLCNWAWHEEAREVIAEAEGRNV